MKETKVCNGCKEEKPRSKFTVQHYYLRKTDGKRTPVLEEKRQARHGPQANRIIHLRQRYNLTLEDFEHLSKNGCNICGSHKALHVDHNHETDKVRGILCQLCNRGLGHFKDNPQLLSTAITYLEKSDV
jgi:protein-arginine kinase activator protein McsA